MNKLLMLVVLFLMVASVTTAGDILKVDFNSTTQDGGPHNLAGWEAYNAGHEVASDFVTVDYGGITVTPAWPNTTDNRVRQMIDRGSGNDAYWVNGAGDLDLVTDFLGTDTRTGNGGNGNWNGTIGTPTFLTLTIGGLAAGDYAWTSFHHDTENVFGAFAVWISVDGGVTFTQLADGLITDSSPGGNPDSGATETGPDAYSLSSTYTTVISADGTNDIVLRFAPYAANAVHQQIWAINGFVLDELFIDPCRNFAPEVEGAEAMLAIVNRPALIEVTVTDDGKPYSDGCDPEQPDTGTSYPMEYHWSQLSGSANAQFNPASADIEDIEVTDTSRSATEIPVSRYLRSGDRLTRHARPVAMNSATLR